MQILEFNPSFWSKRDWEIVEANPHDNTWTLTPLRGYTHISIEGGTPIPWPPEGIKFRFEDRVCIDFEYLGDPNV